MDRLHRENWIATVNSGNAERVRNLLVEYPELQGRVDERVFPFDSSAVFQARKNIDVVDILLEYGADLNQKTGWWAGGFGILEDLGLEDAEALISRGAVVDIWAAVNLGKTDRVGELLDQDPTLITARGGDGKHPLHYAQNPEMVDLLVSRGADVNARDTDHQSTPAQYLVGNEAVVRRLLHHGAMSDVFMAAALGDLEMVRQCLAAEPQCTASRIGVGSWTNTAGGHIYNWTLGQGLTPMDVALEREHQAVVSELLSRASSVTRLSHAIWHDDASAVKQIVNSDPGCVEQLKRQEPALMARAAWEHRVASVARLLQIGFGPHVTGVHNSTPLDRAAFHGYDDIVEMLLEADPNPPLEYKNEFGGTPLTACIFGSTHGWRTGHEQNHVRTAQLLIEAGAHCSVEWIPTGNSEIDALLLAAGS